ncbi:MAG: adenosylcobinamide-GDP ribazoletransferase [Ideonella sp.]|nr:adenosylcobinamide-GDP ribazoletransferase [Ideonella sp.]
MTAPGGRARHELRLWFIALQFLTRVPVPRWVGYEPVWLQDSARHFAGVGLVVGGFGAAVLLASAALWPAPVAVLLSMAATAWLTGAFHEDGLADTCDGLGGSVSRERALEIMKDSRLGSYGALGLGLTLAVKAAALVGLAQASPWVAAAALVAGHAVSRTGSVALLRWLPYAGDPEHAKAKPLAQRIGSAGLGVSVLWTCGAMATSVLVAGAVLGPSVAQAAGSAWLVGAAAAAAAAVVCARWLRRRLGGVTGDTLGATQQWAETAFYLGSLAALGRAGVTVAGG